MSYSSSSDSDLSDDEFDYEIDMINNKIQKLTELNMKQYEQAELLYQQNEILMRKMWKNRYLISNTKTRRDEINTKIKKYEEFRKDFFKEHDRYPEDEEV